MTKHNANNERIKRKFYSYLKEAQRHGEDSVDSAAAALARFERHARYRDFRTFRLEQAIAFKRHLAVQTNSATGKPLSKSTMKSTLAHLKRFFHWLAGQPGYKSRLSYSDSDYFSLTEKDARVATAKRPRPVPTLEQVLHTLAVMPHQTELERRNRAVMAFALLTGARDSAIASIKLKHVDLAEGSVFQDAREVKTKFSKTFTTYFFPVGGDVRTILEDWIRHLREDRLWGNDDPLFPATRMALGPTSQFEAVGLERKHWSSAGPIRGIFREAFTRAGLPYFNPHSLRSTLTLLGQTLCRTPEEFKAWSQNLGHEKVITTFTNYGTVSTARQGELIQVLGSGGSDAERGGLGNAEHLAQEVVRHMLQVGLVATRTE